MLYKILKELNINFTEIEHEPVYTIEEAKKIKTKIVGDGTKSLFLKDKKQNFYLYILDENKKADLKSLAKILATSKLSFGNSIELKDVLGLENGGITPLGIINNLDHNITILISECLQDHFLLFHPNVNTKTISIFYNDLIKFINYYQNPYLIIKDKDM